MLFRIFNMLNKSVHAQMYQNGWRPGLRPGLYRGPHDAPHTTLSSGGAGLLPRPHPLGAFGALTVEPSALNLSLSSTGFPYIYHPDCPQYIMLNPGYFLKLLYVLDIPDSWLYIVVGYT